MGCKSCQIGIIGGSGQDPYSVCSRTVTHDILFCHPARGIPFDIGAEPPREHCESYIRCIDDYPLNDPTILDGRINVFGQSEMVLVLGQFFNYFVPYPVQMIFYRPDGSILFENKTTLPEPKKEWEWYQAYYWGVLGRYSSESGFSRDEIVGPGEYQVDIISPCGIETQKYIVYNDNRRVI